MQVEELEIDLGHTSQRLSHLFDAIVTSYPNSNFVASPLSIYIALAMLAEGCSSITFKELQTICGFESETKVIPQVVQEMLNMIFSGKIKGITLRMSNSIYFNPNSDLNPAYASAVKSNYLAIAETVDFADSDTIQLINNRITEDTNGLLKNTISKLDSKTICVLVNTIYFKGFWQQKFKVQNTLKGDFTLASYGKIQVDFMQDPKKRVGYLTVSNTTYVAIPYEGNNSSLVIEMRKDGQIQRSNIEFVVEASLTEQQDVNLTMPKFKADFKADLIPVLRSLGVNGIFNGQHMSKISNAQITIT